MEYDGRNRKQIKDQDISTNIAKEKSEGNDRLNLDTAVPAKNETLDSK